MHLLRLLPLTNVAYVAVISTDPQDIKTGQKLLEEDWIKVNPEFVKELEIMLASKEKAEIQVRAEEIDEHIRSAPVDLGMFELLIDSILPLVPMSPLPGA